MGKTTLEDLINIVEIDIYISDVYFKLFGEVGENKPLNGTSLYISLKYRITLKICFEKYIYFIFWDSKKNTFCWALENFVVKEKIFFSLNFDDVDDFYVSIEYSCYCPSLPFLDPAVSESVKKFMIKWSNNIVALNVFRDRKLVALFRLSKLTP